MVHIPFSTLEKHPPMLIDVEITRSDHPTDRVLSGGGLVTVRSHSIQLQEIDLAVVMTHNLRKNITNIKWHLVEVRLEICTFSHGVHREESSTLTNHLLETTPRPQEVTRWVLRTYVAGNMV